MIPKSGDRFLEKDHAPTQESTAISCSVVGERDSL
jgi:hypothetical protein